MYKCCTSQYLYSTQCLSTYYVHMTGRNRFGSIRFSSGLSEVLVRSGLAWQFCYSGSMRLGPRFLNASWFGSAFILAIFYPFSQFCEIGISLLSLYKQPKTAPYLFQRGVDYGKCGVLFRPVPKLHGLVRFGRLGAVSYFHYCYYSCLLLLLLLLVLLTLPLFIGL